jgi:hypothetical protein
MPEQIMLYNELESDRQKILSGEFVNVPGLLEQIEAKKNQLLSGAGAIPSVSGGVAGAPPMTTTGGMVVPPAVAGTPESAPPGYSIRPAIGGQIAFGEKEAKIIMDSTGLAMSDALSPEYDVALDPMFYIAANWDVPEPEIITRFGNFMKTVERALSLAQNEQAKEIIKAKIRNNPNYAKIINARWARKMTAGDVVKSPVVAPLDRLFHGGQFAQTIEMTDRLRRLIEGGNQGAPSMGI